MIRYVDSSVVLRALFGEAGAMALPEAACSSRILALEAARAVDRRRALRLLDRDALAAKTAELSQLVATLALATVSDEILARAGSPFPVPVRALDAIHVATAEAFARRDEVEFWTHDARQADAAHARGLGVRGV